MHRKQLAVLGFFIIASIVIIAYSILYFVPRLALDYTQSYVVYFQGQLTGLQIGSPVTIRGIKVGQVSDFKLKYNAKTRHFQVPVFINFYKSSSSELAKHEIISKLVQEGLRAELHVENLLTGKAAIEIEFRPDIPGYVPKDHTYQYVVIPSVPDDEKASNLNDAVDAARNMFESIRKLASSKEVNNAISSFTGAAKSFNTLSNNVNNQVPSISSHLNDSLQEVDRAAYSVRGLSDLLTRHPEAIIKGKQ